VVTRHEQTQNDGREETGAAVRNLKKGGGGREAAGTPRADTCAGPRDAAWGAGCGARGSLCLREGAEGAPNTENSGARREAGFSICWLAAMENGCRFPLRPDSPGRRRTCKWLREANPQGTRRR
jgi:hypothetical protein